MSRKMPNFKAKQKSWIARHGDSVLLRYGGSAIAVWVALSLWTFSPLLHRHASYLFLAAVLFTARYLGFGPAVFGALLSVGCQEVFALHRAPILNAIQGSEFERLVVFFAIAIFAGSMARKTTIAESRLDRTTREMAAIVEYSGDAIFSTSTEGIITSWNRAAEELFGYSAEEAVGMEAAQLAPPDRSEEVEEHRSIFAAGGHVGSYQTERLRKDGKRVPVLMTVSTLRDGRGRIVGASAIARDISAAKQSEEAVRRSEKLATAGRLAASIAHEINNPLEAVVNLLYLARHDPANAAQYLTMAEQQVGQVARLAQQTLGFVRDTSAPGRFSPADLMDEILQLYARKLEGRAIRVTKRYDEVEPLFGYAGELRQLFANLVLNAVEAMPSEGTLQVRVAPGRDWGAGRDGVRITVADNGSGIAAADLEHIFEAFYTTKKDTGTGLGLWVSSGIVRKHGGEIRVRSRARGASDGRACGTVFSIFLPYQREMSRVA